MNAWKINVINSCCDRRAWCAAAGTLIIACDSKNKSYEVRVCLICKNNVHLVLTRYKLNKGTLCMNKNTRIVWKEENNTRWGERADQRRKERREERHFFLRAKKLPEKHRTVIPVKQVLWQVSINTNESSRVMNALHEWKLNKLRPLQRYHGVIFLMVCYT